MFILNTLWLAVLMLGHHYPIVTALNPEEAKCQQHLACSRKSHCCESSGTCCTGDVNSSVTKCDNHVAHNDWTECNHDAYECCKLDGTACCYGSTKRYSPTLLLCLQDLQCSGRSSHCCRKGVCCTHAQLELAQKEMGLNETCTNAEQRTTWSNDCQRSEGPLSCCHGEVCCSDRRIYVVMMMILVVASPLPVFMVGFYVGKMCRAKHSSSTKTDKSEDKTLLAESSSESTSGASSQAPSRATPQATSTKSGSDEVELKELKSKSYNLIAFSSTSNMFSRI